MTFGFNQLSQGTFVDIKKLKTLSRSSLSLSLSFLLVFLLFCLSNFFILIFSFFHLCIHTYIQFHDSQYLCGATVIVCLFLF